MTDWKLGAYVRVWRNEGYEYGHIESITTINTCRNSVFSPSDEELQVMLVGDDGKEIYCRVKDLEEGE